MKRAILILTSLLALQAYGQTHDWENPAVLGINKLPYHATLQLPSKWKACKEIISLDGRWLFRWSRNPEERQTDFYREDYDVSSWGKIKVPGNWPLVSSRMSSTIPFGKPSGFSLSGLRYSNLMQTA